MRRHRHRRQKKTLCRAPRGTRGRLAARNRETEARLIRVRKRHSDRRSSRRAICWIVFGLMVAGAAMGACAGIARDMDGPDVIFISLDTLRRDRVGHYSPAAARLTPALDRLAADAVTFTGAHVQMPFTQTSHMSMFTGLYPTVHGVMNELTALPMGAVTLPQYLRRAGYRTVGIHTCEWLAGVFGFARGFDSYEQLGDKWDLTFSDRLVERGLRAFDEAAGRALFLFWHSYDVHSDLTTPENKLPYFSPAEYRRDLQVDPVGSEYCDAAGNCASEYLLASDPRLDVALLHNQLAAGIAIQLDGERGALSERQLREIAELYDRGVRYLDDDLGAFFEGLKERERYDDALIIVVSDHGEEFGEHGYTLHSQTYEETIAIPLLIKLPGNVHGGEVVDGLVESVDILPTVLDYLGVEERGPVQGQSLLPAIETGRTDRRFSLSQDQIERYRFSLTAGSYKLLYNVRTREAELYHLPSDPHEHTDLATSEPEIATRLEGELRGLLAAHRAHARVLQVRRPVPQQRQGEQSAGSESLLSNEQLERLRSLGYVR